MNSRDLDKASRLADKHTSEELGQMCMETVGNKKQSDILAWAVTLRLAANRAAAGNPVPTCGYSGRQTNRRR